MYNRKRETVKLLEDARAIHDHSLGVYGKPMAAEDILKKLSTAFMKAITTRFQDLSEDPKATEIVSIKNWPTEFDGTVQIQYFTICIL